MGEQVHQKREEATAAVALPNKLGIHARSAAQIVRASAAFTATVVLGANGRTARVSSLMELLRLGARQGTEVTITAEGVDAEQAMQHYRTLLETGFGEE